MTYLLSSENAYESNVMSQMVKSIEFMVFDILLIILTTNNSIPIVYTSTAFFTGY
jgi:hypothetical protein